MKKKEKNFIESNGGVRSDFGLYQNDYPSYET